MLCVFFYFFQIDVEAVAQDPVQEIAHTVIETVEIVVIQEIEIVVIVIVMMKNVVQIEIVQHHVQRELQEIEDTIQDPNLAIVVKKNVQENTRGKLSLSCLL